MSDDRPPPRDSLAPRPAALPGAVCVHLDTILDRAADVLTELAPELSPERIAALAPEIAERCTKPAGDLYVAGVHVGSVGAPTGPLVAHVVAAYLAALALIYRRANAAVPSLVEVAEALERAGVANVALIDIARSCRAAQLPLSSTSEEGL